MIGAEPDKFFRLSLPVQTGERQDPPCFIARLPAQVPIQHHPRVGPPFDGFIGSLIELAPGPGVFRRVRQAFEHPRGHPKPSCVSDSAAFVEWHIGPMRAEVKAPGGGATHQRIDLPPGVAHDQDRAPRGTFVSERTEFRAQPDRFDDRTRF